MCDQKCSVTGCEKYAKNKGMCWGHYSRFRRYGDANISMRPTPATSKPESCIVDGCLASVRSLGYCEKHYHRFRRHGDASIRDRAANGECMEWIYSHVQFDADECLTWPYAVGRRGDAVVLHNGKQRSASRVMCEIAHGIPDESLNLECAHNCGNGHLGCMNPKHLRWDTRSGNHADKVLHGTHNRGERNVRSKLKEDQVLYILRSEDSCKSLAIKYGISASTVSAIRKRKLWKHISI